MAISGSTLMEIDNAIIIGLMAWLLATIAWRRYFRWGTDGDRGATIAGDGEPGVHLDVHLPGKGWNWLVHGLSRAGFTINETHHDKKKEAMETGKKSDIAMVVLDPSRRDPHEVVGSLTREHGTVIVISPPGTRWPSPRVHEHAANGYKPLNIYWIDITFTSTRGNDTDRERHHTTVQASGNRGENAELVVIGTILAWVTCSHPNL